jgi:hypothetical protein
MNLDLAQKLPATPEGSLWSVSASYSDSGDSVVTVSLIDTENPKALPYISKEAKVGIAAQPGNIVGMVVSTAESAVTAFARRKVLDTLGGYYHELTLLEFDIEQEAA